MTTPLDPRTLRVGKSYKALIDAVDYEYLSGFSWHVTKRLAGGRYELRARRSCGGRSVYMHREVLRDELLGRSGVIVDHINGDSLDNRRSNLRITDHAGNARNMVWSPNRKRGLYKGVYLVRLSGKYAAHITAENGNQRHLGCFTTQEEAAEAYDDAALEQWGEHAALNFPDRDTIEKRRTKKAGKCG